MQNPRKTGRREDQRRRGFFTENRGRLIALGNIGEHTGTQRVAFEVLSIGAQRNFVLRAAVDELEYGFR